MDGIVEGIGGEFNILRIDIHTDFGRELRNRFGFTATPEFVLFDGSGREVWRAHTPPAPEQLALVYNPIPTLDTP